MMNLLRWLFGFGPIEFVTLWVGFFLLLRSVPLIIEEVSLFLLDGKLVKVNSVFPIEHYDEFGLNYVLYRVFLCKKDGAMST